VAPILLLTGLVALAYWPAFGCDFIWDDDDYVTNNPVLRTWGGIARIWFEPTSLPQYYPLVHTQFWLEYRLWGPHPLGYHVVNVLLHLAASIALLHLLRRLAVPGALFAAALFAVHPVGVESVAWVTERKNVLSMACALVAAIFWLRWRDSGSRRTWWAATAWFVAALLAKTVTASLPAALLVVQWWRNGRIERTEWKSLLPWFVLGIALGLFTVWLEATHVRASDTAWQLAGAERPVMAGQALWFYLGSLLWPTGLCFNYPRWHLDPSAWVQWLPAAGALTLLTAAFVLRHRIGRAPLATLLLFGGILVPALGFFDVFPFRYSYVADHFQYHASIAIFAAVAAGLTVIARRISYTARVALGGLVLVPLVVLANLHCRDFRDLETSWRATLRCNPDSALAMINLGGLLIDRSEFDKAEQLLERSLEIAPNNYEALANLGAIAHHRKDIATAQRFYEASLQQRRDQTPTLNNLALVHLSAKRMEQALALAREAVDCDPDSYSAHELIVNAAFELRLWQETVEHANWVLLRKPDELFIRLTAARALLELGQYNRALQNAALALRQSQNLSRSRNTFVQAFAHVLKTQPSSGIAARVDRSLRQSGLDPTPIVPMLIEQLRTIGANTHAKALAGSRR